MDFENSSFVPSVIDIDIGDIIEELEDTEGNVWKMKENAKGSKLDQRSAAPEKRERNSMVLELIEVFVDMIGTLCACYGIYCDTGHSNTNQNKKKKFVPHCTIMKSSKLRRKEAKKFSKYNKENKIRLQKEYNQLGDNEKRMNRNKVFDLNILSDALNAKHIEATMDAVTEDNGVDLYQDIAQIDLCAMHGSEKTEDGFYRILHSLSIVPPSAS